MKLRRGDQPSSITSFRKRGEAERLITEQQRHEARATVVAYFLAFGLGLLFMKVLGFI
jgi:hypothetical protein